MNAGLHLPLLCLPAPLLPRLLSYLLPPPHPPERHPRLHNHSAPSGLTSSLLRSNVLISLSLGDPGLPPRPFRVAGSNRPLPSANKSSHNPAFLPAPSGLQSNVFFLPHSSSTAPGLWLLSQRARGIGAKFARRDRTAGRGSLLTLRAPLWGSQLFASSSGCTREALAAHPGVGSAKMWWAPRGRRLLPAPQNGSFGAVLTHLELCSELPW